jgi:hypothetical protein
MLFNSWISKQNECFLGKDILPLQHADEVLYVIESCWCVRIAKALGKKRNVH